MKKESSPMKDITMMPRKQVTFCPDVEVFDVNRIEKENDRRNCWYSVSNKFMCSMQVVSRAKQKCVRVYRMWHVPDSYKRSSLA